MNAGPRRGRDGAEANVTLVDTKPLSCPMGWQVWAAARRQGRCLKNVTSTSSSLEGSEGLFINCLT
jgi:hypothetical protein